MDLWPKPKPRQTEIIQSPITKEEPKKFIEDMKQDTKPKEDEKTICVNCIHYRKNEYDMRHACIAEAEEKINYVTGEKEFDEDSVEDCEDVNDGECEHFKIKWENKQ